MTGARIEGGTIVLAIGAMASLGVVASLGTAAAVGAPVSVCPASAPAAGRELDSATAARELPRDGGSCHRTTATKANEMALSRNASVRPLAAIRSPPIA